MENKKKISGLAKAMIITAVVAAAAIIVSVCFAVSIGSVAMKEIFDNPQSFREAIVSGEKDLDILSEVKDYNILISDEKNDMPVTGDTITVSGKFADINIIASDTDEIKVQFQQYTNVPTTKPTVELEINGQEFAINYDKDSLINAHIYLKLTIAIPKDTIKKVDIKNGIGDIEIDGIFVDALSVTNNVGDIKIKNTETSAASVSNDTGDISLDEGFKSKLTLTVANNIGDIDFTVPDSGTNFELKYTTSVGELGVEDIDLSKYSFTKTQNLTNADGTIKGHNESGERAYYTLETNVGDIELDSSSGS